MMKNVFFIFAILILARPCFLHAQDLSHDFHSLITSLYHFSPHTLTDLEQKSKSSELDKFWQEVKGYPKQYLSLLRKELSNYNNPAFFFYDGSKLLLSLSQSPEDKQLVLQAIAHCDLKDVQNGDYLQTIHSFAFEGLNTADAALHILDYPNFQVFIPQHSLTLGQADALLFMLLPTDESFYLQKAASRLKKETNAISKMSLLFLLHLSATELGNHAVDAFIADLTQPDSLRDIIKGVRERTDKASHLSLSGSDTYESLRAERKHILRRISDEALGELVQVSLKMRQQINKK